MFYPRRKYGRIWVSFLGLSLTGVQAASAAPAFFTPLLSPIVNNTIPPPVCVYETETMRNRGAFVNHPFVSIAKRRKSTSTQREAPFMVLRRVEPVSKIRSPRPRGFVFFCFSYCVLFSTFPRTVAGRSLVAEKRNFTSSVRL